MDRLKRVRQAIDGILLRQPNLRYRHGAYIHLYGVSVNCALLALKRGLDVELAQVAGMLHDISTYQRNDGTDHDRFSAQAAESLLGELGLFSQQEIDAICQAILHHRTKEKVHAPLDELLKDADALHHYLYNPGLEQTAKDEVRIAAVLAELGI